MRRYIILMMIALISLASVVRADDLVDRLSRLKGVSHVTVSHDVLALYADKLQPGDGFPRLSAISDKLDCIVVFNAEGNSARVLYTTSRDLMARYRFRDLLNVRDDDGAVVRITMKDYPSWRQFVVVNCTDDGTGDDAACDASEWDCRIVILNGTLTIEDITGAGER